MTRLKMLRRFVEATNLADFKSAAESSQANGLIFPSVHLRRDPEPFFHRFTTLNTRACFIRQITGELPAVLRHSKVGGGLRRRTLLRSRIRCQWLHKRGNEHTSEKVLIPSLLNSPPLLTLSIIGVDRFRYLFSLTRPILSFL